MEFASFEKAEWTMEDWAAFAGMSVRTLSRQVQAETGLTFRNWRLQHVLLVSLGQLARETSVEEAALTTGYQNTSSSVGICVPAYRALNHRPASSFRTCAKVRS